MSRLFLFSLSFLFLFSSAFSEPASETKDQLKVRELEQSVTELKESVYQAKVRARELEEAVLRGKITGSKALVKFENEAEGFFSLMTAEFYLDGQLVHKVEGKGKKSPILSMEVFDSDLPAGEHMLEAKLFFQGSDKSIYQMFPYFKDHKFNLDAKEKFAVEYGKTTLVKLVALDKGYFKTDVKERLYIQFQTSRDWGTEPAE